MQKKIKLERFIWIDIMFTLMALELMGYFYYGIRAVLMSSICAAVSVLTEIVSLRLMGRKFTADDLTCISDALIVSLMLPAAIDYRIAAIGSVFTVTVAKNVFGGRSNMIFSPAAAAYVFIITSWKSQALMFTEPHVHTGIFEKAGNLVSSASHSFNVSGRLSCTDFEILLGNFVGPTGAVSILLLAVAAVILILRRDISGGAFIGTIAGTSVMAFLVPASVDPSDSVKYALSMNMVLYAAIYIISDRRIAPKRNYYAFFYGFFIAVFSYILVLTTAKENAIVTASVLFTPAALGFRNLEKRIEQAERDEQAELAKNAEEEAAEIE